MNIDLVTLQLHLNFYVKPYRREFIEQILRVQLVQTNGARLIKVDELLWDVH